MVRFFTGKPIWFLNASYVCMTIPFHRFWEFSSAISLNRFSIIFLFYISSLFFSTNSEISSLSVGCLAVLDVVDVFIVFSSHLFVVFL